jgi:hypothetical protein
VLIALVNGSVSVDKIYRRAEITKEKRKKERTLGQTMALPLLFKKHLF